MQAVKDLSRALEKFGVAGLKPRADGRLSVGYDGGRRLDIHTLPDGRLVLEAHLGFLPDPGPARTMLLERALRFSTTRMPSRHDVLCLSSDGDSLLLQCEVPARAGVAAVELALERFLNATDAWWSAVGPGAESAPSQLAARSRPVVVPP
jgi:hypothetical protein